ncbi:MAG TPA: hypothetical protein VHN36_07500, partial [Ilumatobacteraceae bacterium]|nr:hypothetical protein [Ilumatobacteraceae bacterium]
TLVPPECGGLGADMETFGRIVRAIARGCPSSAWQFCLGASHAPMVCRLFDPSLWPEIFGDGHFICPFPARPQGEIRQLEGGEWLLTGTYNYCSGVPYATHLLGQAFPTFRDGSKGAPVVFLAQRPNWTRLDDWGNALGMKGSGSHSVRFDEARIPDRFVLRIDLLEYEPEPLGQDSSSLRNNPAHYGRYESFALFELASIGVGALTGALDEYGDLMRSRTTIFPPITPRIEDSDYRRWYGRTLGRLAMAEAALSNQSTQWTEASRLHMLGLRPFSVEENMRLTLLAGEVIDIVWEAMQTVWSTMGSTPALDGARMQRVFRDLAMLRNHGIGTAFDNMARRLADHTLGPNAQ